MVQHKLSNNLLRTFSCSFFSSYIKLFDALVHIFKCISIINDFLVH